MNDTKSSAVPILPHHRLIAFEGRQGAAVRGEGRTRPRRQASRRSAAIGQVRLSQHGRGRWSGHSRRQGAGLRHRARRDRRGGGRRGNRGALRRLLGCGERFRRAHRQSPRRAAHRLVPVRARSMRLSRRASGRSRGRATRMPGEPSPPGDRGASRGSWSTVAVQVDGPRSTVDCQSFPIPRPGRYPPRGLRA